ncbi:MAG: hypothetical protein M3410_02690 [Acidobacteriota bacterium]|nr:hypothetical protein [Acidobacteriota bacterium]
MEAIEGIKRGLESMKRNTSKPAEKFFQEFLLRKASPNANEALRCSLRGIGSGGRARVLRLFRQDFGEYDKSTSNQVRLKISPCLIPVLIAIVTILYPFMTLKLLEELCFLLEGQVTRPSAVRAKLPHSLTRIGFNPLGIESQRENL